MYQNGEKEPVRPLPVPQIVRVGMEPAALLRPRFQVDVDAVTVRVLGAVGLASLGRVGSGVVVRVLGVLVPHVLPLRLARCVGETKNALYVMLA